MNDAEIRVVQAQIIALLKANPDNRAIKVTMIPEIASLFVDFLHDFDPDMPPRPVCRALGPLLGDVMMNSKLDRLDAVTDRLGVLMVLLERMGK